MKTNCLKGLQHKYTPITTLILQQKKEDVKPPLISYLLNILLKFALKIFTAGKFHGFRCRNSDRFTR